MTERKSLESERAEALANRLAVFTKLSPHDFFEQSLSGSQLQLIVTALHSLATQDQKPVAWDDLNCATGRSCEYGPYGPNGEQQCQYCGHNAPPDSGAGKSDDAGARISNLAADLVVSGWMASNAQDVERHKKEAEQKLLDFACDEVERHIKRDPSVMPDHGGADAGVKLVRNLQSYLRVLRSSRERNIALEVWKSDIDLIERSVAALSKPAPVAANASAVLQNDLAEMLRALGMSDAAQPRSPHEVFQSAIAEMKRQLTNASAEARLREALEKLKNEAVGMLALGEAAMRQAVGNTNVNCLQHWIENAEEALSAHPHASDCDKQGETGMNWQVSDETLRHIEEINANRRNATINANNIVAGNPSDRTADVTVEELEAWLLERWRLITIAELACALLDAFTVRRR